MKGRTAIITGGASKKGGLTGIGKATAIKLLQLGVNVCICDLMEEYVVDTLEELHEMGFHVIGMQADVCSQEDMDAVVKLCIDEYKAVDYLVTCSGKKQKCLLKDLSLTEWKQVIDVNLNGVFIASKSVIGHMISQNFGVIINVSSVSGITGAPGDTHYSASKAGVIGFTKALAREVAENNIRVHSLTPGQIETQILEQVILNKEAREVSLDKIPMKRFGKPGEAASVIAFLLSEEASFMTGQTINVCGGYCMNT